MVPTLHNGQTLPVCLVCVMVRTPRVGDVVIVAYGGDRSLHFVKRVTAVPGDTVEFHGRDIVLGTDQFFVAGDNRDFSTDSRTYGPVLRGQLIGLVMGQHLPPDELVDLRIR